MDLPICTRIDIVFVRDTSIMKTLLKADLDAIEIFILHAGLRQYLFKTALHGKGTSSVLLRHNSSPSHTQAYCTKSMSK